MPTFISRALLTKSFNIGTQSEGMEKKFAAKKRREFDDAIMKFRYILKGERRLTFPSQDFWTFFVEMIACDYEG